jgi:hypothetical protein
VEFLLFSSFFFFLPSSPSSVLRPISLHVSSASILRRARIRRNLKTLYHYCLKVKEKNTQFKGLCNMDYIHKTKGANTTDFCGTNKIPTFSLSPGSVHFSCPSSFFMIPSSCIGGHADPLGH